MTPDTIAAHLEYMAKRLRNGCGNAGCLIKEPEGMHTNGSCHCMPSKFARHLMGIAIECDQQGQCWSKPKE